MIRAYETGKTDTVEIHPTLADGLAGNLEPATITVGIAREHVESMVAVDEDQTRLMHRAGVPPAWVLGSPELPKADKPHREEH